jgi:hypothetical protein
MRRKRRKYKKKVIDNIQLTHFATTPKSTFP